MTGAIIFDRIASANSISIKFLIMLPKITVKFLIKTYIFGKHDKYMVYLYIVYEMRKHFLGIGLYSLRNEIGSIRSSCFSTGLKARTPTGNTMVFRSSPISIVS